MGFRKFALACRALLRAKRDTFDCFQQVRQILRQDNRFDRIGILDCNIVHRFIVREAFATYLYPCRAAMAVLHRQPSMCRRVEHELSEDFGFVHLVLVGRYRLEQAPAYQHDELRFRPCNRHVETLGREYEIRLRRREFRVRHGVGQQDNVPFLALDAIDRLHETGWTEIGRQRCPDAGILGAMRADDRETFRPELRGDVPPLPSADHPIGQFIGQAGGKACFERVRCCRDRTVVKEDGDREGRVENVPLPVLQSSLPLSDQRQRSIRHRGAIDAGIKFLFRETGQRLIEPEGFVERVFGQSAGFEKCVERPADLPLFQLDLAARPDWRQLAVVTSDDQASILTQAAHRHQAMGNHHLRRLVDADEVEKIAGEPVSCGACVENPKQ
ncbi:hypothetical protein FHT80_006368 [Rhizobium sp. BK226]|nr:hypothetical protein [Rhizobium sp. BK226]MBB4116987.1 hypothetical protein [Rhizobium sp. BK226]